MLIFTNVAADPWKSYRLVKCIFQMPFDCHKEFPYLKVDFETVLDLVFQTLGKDFIKVNFRKCSVKTQIGDPILHICPGPRGFSGCGTCSRKTRKILGKLGWWVLPIPWIKLCF